MNLVIFLLVLIVILAMLAPMIGLNVIFLAVGAIVAWAIIMRNKSINENLNKVPEQTLHIINVEKGGVFELRGVGELMEEMTLHVLAKHLYQEGDFSWFELECDKGSGEKVWVEVEDDDETTVSVVLKKMKLNETGVTSYELSQIDELESGNVNFDSKTFKYVDSGDAVFYRFCDDARTEKLYYWDFESGNKTFSVEKWGESDYEAFLSQKMHPAQVTVLRNNDVSA